MKIESNIPAPPEYGHKTNITVNVLSEMKHGDSYLFTYKEMRTTKAMNIRAAIYYGASLLSIHVRTRKQNTGVRAWKVQ